MSEDHLYIDQEWVDALGLPRDQIAELSLRDFVALCFARGIEPTVKVVNPGEQREVGMSGESEMVERVARALQRRDVPDPVEADAIWNQCLEPDAYKDAYRADARAAIEAMREPTKEMLEPLKMASYGYSEYGVDSSLETWQEAIDAALRTDEGKSG